MSHKRDFLQRRIEIAASGFRHAMNSHLGGYDLQLGGPNEMGLVEGSYRKREVTFLGMRNGDVHKTVKAVVSLNGT
jgi:hypothetical protein